MWRVFQYIICHLVTFVISSEFFQNPNFLIGIFELVISKVIGVCVINQIVDYNQCGITVIGKLIILT